MLRRKKYKLADFPEAGTVFAMPLKDGRTGICRVIRKEIKSIPCALVAASDWIANEPPPLNHPAIRKILVKNHHNWKNSPDVRWVTSLPPKEFRIIGNIDVTSQDVKTECRSYGAWESLATQVLAQWRWDNERESVLAEDAEKNTLELAKRKEAIQKRADYLAIISFSILLAKDLFPTWNDYPPKVVKEGCQEIVQSFIRVLDGAEKPLDRNLVSKELKKAIEELNQYDSKNKKFIETEEREDLCEVFEDILNAAKFPDLVESVEDWKDW